MSKLIQHFPLQIIGLLLCSFTLIAQDSQNDWPVLKHYDKDHLSQIAMPLGGIGTGTVSIGGRGDLRDWEIMNWPGKGFYPIWKNGAPFFTIYVKPQGEDSKIKALIGPLEDHEYHHFEGRQPANFGFPRFKSATFDAAYPLVQVNLKDPDLPVDVKLKAFNPLIPGDLEASGIPIAILTYEVTNRTSRILDVTVAGNMVNFVGIDGSKTEINEKGEYLPYGNSHNKNQYREGHGLVGIYMYSDSVDRNDPAWGTMALSANVEGKLSHQTASSPFGMWNELKNYGTLLPLDNPLDQKPFAALALSRVLRAGETAEFTFYITWHFPNRKAWWDEEHIVGNYYTTRYTDAWDVITKVHPALPVLEEQTVAFVSSFVNSSLSESIQEAALFNVSTLRSQTVFRAADGNMFGWEGIADNIPLGHGNCTHVWNYELTTPFLFGELAKTMRHVEFNHATNDRGLMSFRIGLPLEEKAQELEYTATDGQLGAVMRFYREWQLSGDDGFLEEHWPKIRKAVEFAWIENGWDGDRDGLMEGCQHNTMDIEFFGPHPELQFWYLGALKATEQMALAMGEKKFAKECASLFDSGSKLTDEQLFNGEYYRQIISASCTKEEIPPGLRAGYYEPDVDVNNPNFQLGNGCLTDQLVGQNMAHILNLGDLADPGNVKKALESIWKYNHLESLEDHLTTTRGYALADEAGVIVATWPHGDSPDIPFPYSSEVWTGLEYTAASGMMYMGMRDEALQIVTDARNRFEGSRRNPFNEMEYGNHYARALASWATVLAESGFHFSAVDQSMEFAGKEGTWFWSNGYAWGNCTISQDSINTRVELEVLHGEVSLKQFTLKGVGVKKFKKLQTIGVDKVLEFQL